MGCALGVGEVGRDFAVISKRVQFSQRACERREDRSDSETVVGIDGFCSSVEVSVAVSVEAGADEV